MKDKIKLLLNRKEPIDNLFVKLSHVMFDKEHLLLKSSTELNGLIKQIKDEITYIYGYIKYINEELSNGILNNDLLINSEDTIYTTRDNINLKNNDLFYYINQEFIGIGRTCNRNSILFASNFPIFGRVENAVNFIIGN